MMKKTEHVALSPALAMVVKVVLASTAERRKGGKYGINEICIGVIGSFGFGKGGGENKVD